MGHAKWRLIIEGRSDAAWNMAVDEAILNAVEAGTSHPTLRLYEWHPYVVSLGRFQSVARTTMNNATVCGRQPVRRITGGRGILHGDDQTVSIACRCADIGVHAAASVLELYTVFSSVFTRAFERIGVDAMQGDQLAPRAAHGGGNCFSTVTAADLAYRASGVKAVGCAIYRRSELLLLQSSIPLGTARTRNELAKLSASVFRAVCSDATPELTPAIIREQFIQALIETAENQTCAGLELEPVTSTERIVAQRLVNTKYGEPGWTMHGRIHPATRTIDTH